MGVHSGEPVTTSMPKPTSVSIGCVGGVAPHSSSGLLLQVLSGDSENMSSAGGELKWNRSWWSQLIMAVSWRLQAAHGTPNSGRLTRRHGKGAVPRPGLDPLSDPFDTKSGRPLPRLDSYAALQG